MTFLTWNSPPDPLHLDDSAVHIWRIIHPVDGNAVGSYLNYLSPDERKRSERFHKRFDAERFIANHSILRLTLSRYLMLDPHEIQFKTNPLGKPSLVNEQNPTRLEYNSSHSGEVLLIAIARNQRVGIDVELIKPIPEMDRMVEQYFSKSEFETFASLPEPERIPAFYAAWTRKEAYLKLIGEGLQHPPDRIEVSLNPNDPFPDLELLDRGLHQASSSLISFEPADGYQAALAVEGESRDVVPIQYANAIPQ